MARGGRLGTDSRKEGNGKTTGTFKGFNISPALNAGRQHKASGSICSASYSPKALRTNPYTLLSQLPQSTISIQELPFLPVTLETVMSRQILCGFQHFHSFCYCLRIYFSVCVYMCAHKGQKSVSDPLEPELQAAVGHPRWMFGTLLWSFEKAIQS